MSAVAAGTSLDERLLLLINQGGAHPWLDIVMPWVSAKAGFSFPLLLAIVFYLGWRHGRDGWWAGLALLALVALGDLLGNLFKHWLGQSRPCLDMAEFLRFPGGGPFPPCEQSRTGMPSNHALNFFAVLAYLRFVWRGHPLWLLMLVIAFAVAWSRIYLGQHYPSQVAAGAVLGLVIGWLYVRFCRWRWAFLDRIRAEEGGR